MEEQKLPLTPAKHHHIPEPTYSLWQWQSDLDPFQETNPAKWTWQNYSDEECAIIEEAFGLDQEFIDLKEHEIDLRKMLQVHKRFRNQVRRVRRQEKSRFMIEMPEPKIERTMNQAFGTIQHFLEYIMKRTPEAYGLYQRLERLMENYNYRDFEDIIQEVIGSIEKGAQAREKIMKTRSNSQTTNFIMEAKLITNILKRNSQLPKNFLQAILKVYTMETFVCYWLNELLRSESWEEINVLTPYLVCLVYTFKLEDHIIPHEKPQGFLNHLLGFFTSQKLFLYRGAALTKEHLASYDPKKVKYFSWNAITSTSRSKNVAKKFVEFSLEKARKLEEPKVGVIFLIEADFVSLEDCEGMIDISQGSQHPDEQEIILAPGTVFKLLKVRLNSDNIHEITLKVTRKFEEEAQKDLALLGTLQEQAIFKEKAIIEGLPSQESFRLLGLIKGNQLFRKMEIRNSGIEEYIMEEIERIRRTTKVKKQYIKVLENIIVVGKLSPLCYYFSPENLSDIFLTNKVKFKEGLAERDYEWKTSLVLKERAIKKLRSMGQLRELWEVIKHDGQFVSVDVSMKNIPITNDEVLHFLESIGHLQHLENLSLTLDHKIPRSAQDLSLTIESFHALKQLSLELVSSDKELSLFKKALPPSLQHLHLHFTSCKHISDEGLSHLEPALTSLTSLRHLELHFTPSNRISDEGLNHIKNGLLALPFLLHLSLVLNDCNRISDEGLNHLKTALTAFKYLQHASLHFPWCTELSNQGLGYLKTGLFSLASLNSLSLNFTRCDKISDEGLDNLQTALKPLKYLEQLSLNFTRCFKISDDGLNLLSNGLTPLKKCLKNLALDFIKCKKVTDKGLGYLNNSLRSLISLQSLNLQFSDCLNISDEGLNYLSSGLASLKSLQNLSLGFVKCEKISNEAIKNVLQPLKYLQHLSLNFSENIKISDEGLNHLKTTLTNLKYLKHLSINFAKCEKISDQGLNYIRAGLTSLVFLQNLALNFTSCDKMTDDGLNYLKTAFSPFVDLQHLSLEFSLCGKITDKGLNSLSNLLASLGSLQNLSLDLSRCNELSGEGLNYLKSGVKSLTSLQEFFANFSGCKQILDEELKDFKNEFQLIMSLESPQ